MEYNNDFLKEDFCNKMALVYEKKISNFSIKLLKTLYNQINSNDTNNELIMTLQYLPKPDDKFEVDIFKNNLEENFWRKNIVFDSQIFKNNGTDLKIDNIDSLIKYKPKYINFKHVNNLLSNFTKITNKSIIQDIPENEKPGFFSTFIGGSNNRKDANTIKGENFLKKLGLNENNKIKKLPNHKNKLQEINFNKQEIISNRNKQKQNLEENNSNRNTQRQNLEENNYNRNRQRQNLEENNSNRNRQRQNLEENNSNRNTQRQNLEKNNSNRNMQRQYVEENNSNRNMQRQYVEENNSNRNMKRQYVEENNSNRNNKIQNLKENLSEQKNKLKNLREKVYNEEIKNISKEPNKNLEEDLDIQSRTNTISSKEINKTTNNIINQHLNISKEDIDNKLVNSFIKYSVPKNYESPEPLCNNSEKCSLTKKELCQAITENFIVRNNIIAAILTTIPYKNENGQYEGGLCYQKFLNLETCKVCVPYNFKNLIEDDFNIENIITKILEKADYLDEKMCKENQGYFFKLSPREKLILAKKKSTMTEEQLKNHPSLKYNLYFFEFTQKLKDKYFINLNSLILILEKIKETPIINNETLNIISNETKKIIDEMYSLCHYYYVYAIISLINADITEQKIEKIDKLSSVVSKALVKNSGKEVV